MELPKEYHCEACDYVLSHPIDSCPICGDQFYWRLNTRRPLTPEQRHGYLQTVEEVIGRPVNKAFVAHGGQVWLPHNFWNFDPNGRVLDRLLWATGIEKYQHKKSERTQEPTRKKDPSTWDTNPGFLLPEHIQREFASASKDEPAAVSPHSEQRPDDGLPTSKKGPSPPGDPGVAGPGIPSMSDFFAPLMILIFFLFLSLSYLSLRYHKNTKPTTAETEVVADENTVLP